jgi:molybdate transport system ATP-binding protein
MSVQARLVLRRGEFLLDAAFDAPGRGVTAVYGRSGSGKTSLVRSLAGLERASGTLLVGDQEWLGQDRFVPAHARDAAVVFQDAQLFSHLDVRRNLEYGLRRTPPHIRRLDLERVTSMLGLGDYLERMPVTLSGGETRRVALAQVLLTSPRIMLLDEPLSGLDSLAAREILAWLDIVFAELDIPVIYVTHSLDEVARLADTLMLLSGGQVSAIGPVAEMLTRLDLPLTDGDGAEALVQATVDSHDEDYGLTFLSFSGGRLTVPHQSLEPGRTVRLRVAARDVSLTLERQSDTSILNILPATVKEVAVRGKSQVMVRLEAGGQPLLAQVTRRSADALALAAGREVFVQAKSIAVLV